MTTAPRHKGLCSPREHAPLDEQGTVVAPGDYEAQALCAVENLLAALVPHAVRADLDGLPAGQPLIPRPREPSAGKPSAGKPSVGKH